MAFPDFFGIISLYVDWHRDSVQKTDLIETMQGIGQLIYSTVYDNFVETIREMPFLHAHYIMCKFRIVDP
jgi:hypothetical protein